MTGTDGSGNGGKLYEHYFKKENEKSDGLRKPGHRSSRRIIGYTLGHSAASIKR
jgi:hypothetical protein